MSSDIVAQSHIRIIQLANLIRARKAVGESPYILLIGAGASISSGIDSMAQLTTKIVTEYTSRVLSPASQGQELEKLYELLGEAGSTERFLILHRYFQKITGSIGYKYLTKLIQSNYFSLIVTTNFDLLLETAFAENGVKADEYIVLINHHTSPDQLSQLLTYTSPRVKLLKLNGDLNARIFAITPEEIFQFSKEIENTLQRILRGDLIIVGHSLRDNNLNRCISADGGAIWYINPSRPSATDFVSSAMKSRGVPSHFIHGKDGEFDNFFLWLALSLLLPDPKDAKDKEEELLSRFGELRREARIKEALDILDALTQLYENQELHEKLEMCLEISRHFKLQGY